MHQQNLVTMSEVIALVEEDILYGMELLRQNQRDVEEAKSRINSAKDDGERIFWEERLRQLEDWRLSSVMTPMMFWGPPGVGKTKGIIHAVENVMLKHGIRAKAIVSQMSTYDAIAIRGLPIPDKENRTTVWLPQDSFPREENCKDYDIVVWFIDELSTAPRSVQPALYSLLQHGMLENGLRLPRNVMIVAAGNDKDDRAITVDMSSAMSNRIAHFDVRPSLDAWKDWALQAGIHPLVIAFHNANEGMYLHKLDADTTGMIKGYPTPRSWENVSKDLERFQDSRLREVRVIAHVGPEAGTAFNTFFRVHDQLPDPEKILEGTVKDIPEEDHMKFAVFSNLVAHLRKKYDEKRLENFFSYVSAATVHRKEMGVVAIQDLLRASDNKLRKMVLVTKGWKTWANSIINLQSW